MWRAGASAAALSLAAESSGPPSSSSAIIVDIWLCKVVDWPGRVEDGGAVIVNARQTIAIEVR